MAENKIWTAEELLALSPDERDQVIRESVITDPDKIPTALTERARLKADARIAATESDHRAR
jgi:hypothetical protein